MIIYRTNLKPACPPAEPVGSGTPDVPERRLAKPLAAGGSGTPPPPAPPSPPREPPLPPGDIIYGAKAIAAYLFGDDGSRSRRRVFNVWNHYRDRNERAGFFKLNGGLCLSISQWTKFHGLG